MRAGGLGHLMGSQAPVQTRMGDFSMPWENLFQFIAYMLLALWFTRLCRMVLGLWDLDEAIHSGNLTRVGHEQQLGEIEMHWGGEAHQQVLRSIVKPAGLPVEQISLPFSLDRSSVKVTRCLVSTHDRETSRGVHLGNQQQQQQQQQQEHQVTGVQFTYTASERVVLEVAFGVDERELARLIDERNGFCSGPRRARSVFSGMGTALSRGLASVIKRCRRRRGGGGYRKVGVMGGLGLEEGGGLSVEGVGGKEEEEEEGEEGGGADWWRFWNPSHVTSIVHQLRPGERLQFNSYLDGDGESPSLRSQQHPVSPPPRPLASPPQEEARLSTPWPFHRLRGQSSHGNESVGHGGEEGQGRGGGESLFMAVRLGCGTNQEDEGGACSDHAMPPKTDIVQLFVLHPLEAATCHRHVHYVARDDACYSIHGVYGDGSDGAEVEECAICFAEPRDTCLIPCGHNCVCAFCFERLSTCPVCRSPFTAYIRGVGGGGGGGGGEKSATGNVVG